MQPGGEGGGVLLIWVRVVWVLVLSCGAAFPKGGT